MCREVAVLELSCTGTGYSARSNVGVRSCYEPAAVLVENGKLKVENWDVWITLLKKRASGLLFGW